MNQTNDTRYDIDFKDYSFNEEPGVFSYRLQKKLKSKSGRMSIFVEGAGGVKHQITLYPDSNFLGVESVSEGTKISVEFVCSKNGKIYAKSIKVEG